MPGAHTTVTVAVDHDGDAATFGLSQVLCTDGTIPAGYAVPSTTNDCDDIDAARQTGCGTCVTRFMAGRTLVACSDLKDHYPAKSACEARDLDLASIHSMDEVAFIQETIEILGFPSLPGSNFGMTWIGRFESPVQWYDGSALDFAHYLEGGAQPGNAVGADGELCVTIRADARTWDDEDCGGHVHPYLCASPP